MNAARILVIEDDDDTAALILTVLQRAGLRAARQADGRSGMRVLHETRPSLIVLDVGLPGLDGWSVLERIRDVSEVPVLMLTGHTHRTDVVRGLQAGADDYLVKPFDTAGLLARVQALLRRGRSETGVSDPGATVTVDGPLVIDQAARTVTMAGAPIELTPIEFRLLSTLVRHAGQVLAPAQLLEHAWSDPSGISPDRVKFSVHRLRRKLGWEADRSPIEAVRGFGYRYRSQADA